MITFRLCDIEAGETSPHIEPRVYYKAYLQHINRRDHASHVRVSTRTCGKNTIKTAYITSVNPKNFAQMLGEIKNG